MDKSVLILFLFICLNGYSQAPAIEWQRDYGGLNNDAAVSIERTNNDGYIVGGTTSSTISGDVADPPLGAGGDFWILKLNSSGDIIWQKRYGG